MTRIDRGYTDTPDNLVVTRLEDFNGATGTSSFGRPLFVDGVGYDHVPVPSHDPTQRAASITWSGSGVHRLQIDIADQAVAGCWIRSALLSSGSLANAIRMKNARCRIRLNASDTTDFSIRLVRANGSLTPAVPLSSHLQLRGPVGLLEEYDGSAVLHPILMTARLPLSDFGIGPGATLHGIRFSFDRTGQGAIYLADIRLSRRGNESGDVTAMSAATVQPNLQPEPPVATATPARTRARASIVAMRHVSATATGVARAATPGGSVEIEVAADRPLPVTDALPSLKIGDERFDRGRFRRKAVRTASHHARCAALRGTCRRRADGSGRCGATATLAAARQVRAAIEPARAGGGFVGFRTAGPGNSAQIAPRRIRDLD